ncbi:hypothetical protein Tco_0357637 [Tanacetum coccineum]
MGRDTIQLEDAMSTISQEYLLEFASEYYIPKNLHPELPGPGDHIVDFLEGKVGIYTKKFEFANFRIPVSQFLFDILRYYQIHLSQLSVIGAAKVSRFKINCRILNIIPTVNLFRVFYVSSYNSGWMDFSKRPGKNTPQCYTKPLDSLKNWNNRFFWVDEKVFPTVVAWRTAATKDDKTKANTYSVVDVATLDTHQMDLFNLIKASNPTKVKTGTRQQTDHEVPLLAATASHVIQMVDATELSTSSGIPSTVERPTAVEQEIPVTDDAEATEAAVDPDLEKEVISMGPTIKKRCRQRDAGEGGSNAPAKVLKRDHDAARAEHSARGGKSLADMSVDTEPAIHGQETQEPPVATQSVSDPDPLSYVDNIFSLFGGCRSSKEAGGAGNQDSKNSTPSPSITGSLGSIYQPGWDVPNDCHLDTPEACQDVVDHIAPPGYFSKLRHMPNDEFLSQYNINLAKQVAMGSQLRLRFEQEAKLLKKSVAQVARRDQRIATREKHIKDLEAQLEAEMNMKKAAEVKNSEVIKELEDLRMRFSGLEVGNAQLSQQVSVLQARVMGEEKIMAAFKVFKKHEDERVNARCAEMDAQLDALSIDFDEELYPHMLTAIAAKGMSEGLKYGVEHGKAGLELTAMEAYDLEADSKYVAALHDLKDLNYPLIDELEQLKDAPLDVIMASLYLDSDIGEDAPQFIRDLHPSSSQLKIPVYPEVRSPRNP